MKKNNQCKLYTLAGFGLVLLLMLMNCSKQATHPSIVEQKAQTPEKPLLHNYQNISSKELYQTYQSLPWKIIDIRTKEEFESGHLPGAILFPWADFSEENFLKHKLSKDDYLLIYCNSGVRSLPPSEMLARHGYQKVYNLLDGIRGWPHEIKVIP